MLTQKPLLTSRVIVRSLGLIGAFAALPLLFFWFAIHPSVQRLQGFQERMAGATRSQPPTFFRMTSALSAEQASLPELQKHLFARVPIVGQPEDLMRYGVVLSNALSTAAAQLGLHVGGVEAFNELVKGQYAPDSSSSLDELARWPRLSTNEVAEPMRIPALDMPSLELDLALSGDYSNVFRFVESLPAFPVLVNVSGISVNNDGAGVSFHLKIRGYYAAPTKGEGSLPPRNAGTDAALQGNSRHYPWTSDKAIGALQC